VTIIVERELTPYERCSMVRKRTDATTTLVPGASGQRIYVHALTINAEADDLRVTVHFGTAGDATALETVHLKAGGVLHCDYPVPMVSGAGEALTATLESGTGYFTVTAKYVRR